MPLTFIHPTGEEPMYVATSRLYVNRDYTKIVPEGSLEAARLLAAVGDGVEMALARRLGLLDPPPVEPEPAPVEPEPAPVEPEPAPVEPEPDARMATGPPADKDERQRRTRAAE
jgi:hypothetical protein